MLAKVIQLIKLVCWIYIAGFAVVAFHVPRTVLDMGKDKQPEVLLTPVFAPAILRAYAQFVASLTWPYSSPKDLIRLNDLLQTRGSYDSLWHRSLVFDKAPVLVKNRPNSIVIARERYQISASIVAFPTYERGIVLRIGSYFCLTDLDPTRKSRCFTISESRGGHYFWQKLGETERQPAHIWRS